MLSVICLTLNSILYYNKQELFDSFSKKGLYAGVAKLVDAQASGACEVIHVGSSPIPCTT